MTEQELQALKSKFDSWRMEPSSWRREEMAIGISTEAALYGVALPEVRVTVTLTVEG